MQVFANSLQIDFKIALQYHPELNVWGTVSHGTPVSVTCEKDVFDYLEMEYKEPTERDWSYKLYVWSYLV